MFLTIRSASSSALLLLTLLAGCADNDSYTQDTKLTAATAASLTGSINYINNPLSPDPVVYLVAIDGRYTGSGWSAWNKPMLLPPGHHQIIFSQCYCNQWQSGNSGTVGVDADFQSGAQYSLIATAPVRATLVSEAISQGWITDAHGASVSRKVVITLNAQPSSGGIVPIFIPAH